MFLIKIAQTNSDITDNYFQFGEEKKYSKWQKKFGEDFQTECDGSEASLILMGPAGGAV